MRTQHVLLCAVVVCCIYVFFNIFFTLLSHIKFDEEDEVEGADQTMSTQDLYETKLTNYQIYAPVKLENAIVMFLSQSNYQFVKKTISCMQIDETKYILLIGTNIDFNIQNDAETFLRVQYVRFPVEKYPNVTDGNWPEMFFETLKSKYTQVASDYVSTITNTADQYDPKVMAKHYALTNQDFLICLTDKKKAAVKRKKFGIVVPYVRDQRELLLGQLKRWTMNEFRPCTASYSSENELLQFELLFYGHKTRDETLEDDIASVLTPINQCFSQVHFRYAFLTEEQDKYPWGPNHMFFRMVHAPDMYLNYQYALYAEPDLYPIRSNWIGYLSKLITGSTRPFWILGSIYRGKHSTLGRMHYNLHLNGNAIYNVGSGAFRMFLFAVSQEVHREAFDTAIAKYLFSRTHRMRGLWHHFRYEDLFMNIYDMQWSLRQVQLDYPYTFFIHGKLNDVGLPSKKREIPPTVAIGGV